MKNFRSYANPVTCLLLAVCGVGAPVALAGEPDFLEDAAVPADTSEPERASDDAAPAAEPTNPPAAQPAAADAPPNEDTIYVVQGKPFLAAGRFEIAPQLVQSVNDSFTSHSGAMVSGIYHLQENVALELTLGTFMWWDDAFGGSKTAPRLGGRDTDLTLEIRDKERLAPERVKLYQYTWVATTDLQWSPLYGKVNVQDLFLGQFNMYLSVGAGFMGLQLESQTQTGIGEKDYEDLKGPFDGALPPMTLTTTFGGGLRFYFTDWLGVRFEVRDYVSALSVRVEEVQGEAAATFDVANLLVAQLGVSFIF